MKSPCVYLVGAGPGDPSLITVRGLRCLARADVVVHDHLIPARMLRGARPDAERIDVGPAAPGLVEQDAISMLLVEKAREDKVVVRLKWGDPYVFDSGGKEALFLHEQGIPYEVVPGLPAALAAPAYAGVPVTYPGAGDTLTFVRGHEGESDEPPEVNWPLLAGLDGTLVCYAGARQVPAILDRLLAHGRPADEPAVLIYRGTQPDQHTIQSTLEGLAEDVRRVPSPQPAILVVGRVAGLREHLRWFDDRPLFGRRVLVTRSREQAAELVEMLEERGALAIEAPTIRLLPPEDLGALDAAVAQAGSFDWIVFTSANGVDHFIRRLLAGPGDVRDLKGARLCTIGPSTAGRLARYGIRVDLIPAEYRAEAVAEALRQHADLRGKRILLPRADIARELLAEELRAAGADVTEVTAYRTVLEEGGRAGDHDVYRMLLDRQIDAVTFTSASTVRNFVQILGPDAAADLLQTTAVASIGPVTAEAAQQLGIETTIMPATYTLAALVDALVEHFQATPGLERPGLRATRTDTPGLRGLAYGSWPPDS